jgi:hypothetical protein
MLTKLFFFFFNIVYMLELNNQMGITARQKIEQTKKKETDKEHL